MEERRPPDPFDPRDFRADGHRLVDRLADYLERAFQDADMPVIDWHAPDSLAARWPVPETADATLDAVVDRLVGDAVHQHHPRCMGHQVAVPMPRAALIEMVMGILNNGMASYESGPVSSALERNVIAWLCRQVGFPTSADGVLTSGGTLGTLTALLAARHQLDGYSVDDGVVSAGPLAIIASDQAHYCVSRAATVIGIGAASVVRAETDASFRMQGEAVEKALDRALALGRRPMAVVATAGATPTGSFDALSDIADVCQARGVWLHVDGAHGASVAVSESYRPLLEGIERADSVVWDAHKLLALPALTSAVLFRRGTASYAPFAEDASYLFPSDEPERWYDYGVRNMECTKRMMSVQLYAALACVGRQALARYVTSRIDLAKAFAAKVRALPDFEIAVEPACNIVCFRRTKGGKPAPDAFHDAVRRRIVESGEFFFTRAVLRGEVWLRVTLMHPHTELSHLDALLERIRAYEA